MRVSTQKFFLLSAAALVIVGVVFISLYSFNAQATAYRLYATTCLGGWENPHLAAGQPDAFELGKSPQYSKENSAQLNGDVHAQIYCGGFAGEILENTIPKRILVKFSAATAEPEAVQLEESEVIPEAPEAVEIIESQESPDDTEEDTSPIEELVEEVAPEEPTLEEPTPEEPTSAEPPISLFNFFVNVARAQEIEAKETQPIAPAEGIDAEEVPEDEHSSGFEDVIVSESSTQTDAMPYGIAEVFYTLDGIAWMSLGVVGKDEFGSAYFEIPIEEASDWEDISKIQIGVQSIPVIDGIVPIMYLDSVWLEVSYGDAEETIVEEKVLSEEVYEEAVEDEEEVVLEEFEEEYIEPLPLLSTRIFSEEIVIDPNARHLCRAEPFIVDISNQDLRSTSIALEKPAEDTYNYYRVEIGGLPNGINIVFTDNGDYLYRPDSSQNTLILDIQNEEGSQKGDFSVPIIFTREEVEDSSVICQMNITNL